MIPKKYLFILAAIIILFLVLKISNFNKQSSKNSTTTLELVKLIGEKNCTRSDLDNKIIVFNLWATWCKPCLEEIPELNKLVQDFDTAQIKFYAITEEDSLKAATFLEKQKITFNYNKLYSSKKLVEYLYSFNLNQSSFISIKSLPYNVVIDKTGTIVYAVSGYSKKTASELRSHISIQVADIRKSNQVSKKSE